MRFIYAQPATIKFNWQIQVAVTNLLDLGVSPKDIFVIYAVNLKRDITYQPNLPELIRNKYHVNVFAYDDNREEEAKRYIPSIKPYLLWRFFSDQTKEVNYDYMYQDSDVVYKRLPNFNRTPVTPKHWYGSDTSSYLDATYIDSKGSDLLDKMANNVGVPSELVRSLKGNSIGAQLVMSNPLAEYWRRSYMASYRLYDYLGKIEPEYKERYKREGRPNEYVIQRWTAQMWTDLWIPASMGVKMEPSKELDFVWATDTMKDLAKVNIYHDAGAGPKDKTKFYKGNYNNVLPFGQNFSYVDKNSASYFYVKQIEKVPK